jgi:hypothetical protein
MRVFGFARHTGFWFVVAHGYAIDRKGNTVFSSMLATISRRIPYEETG